MVMAVPVLIVDIQHKAILKCSGTVILNIRAELLGITRKYS